MLSIVIKNRVRKRLASQAPQKRCFIIFSSKKGPQNCPKSVPKRSKSDPRGPQERSKRPQRALQAAKRLQETPGSPPRTDPDPSKDQFRDRFWTILGSKRPPKNNNGNYKMTMRTTTNMTKAAFGRKSNPKC